MIAFLRRSYLRLLLLSFIGLSGPGALAAAWAAEPIGHVELQQGGVNVERGSVRMPLWPGDPVFLDDRIFTDKDGRVKIGFVDDSVLSVGSDSEVVLDAYRFGRDGRRLHAAITLVLGIVRAVVTAGTPSSVFNVETSVAVASARSTDWLVEAGVDRSAVFVSEGRVEVAVRSGGAGAVLTPGLGIDVFAGRSVGMVKRWGAQRIAEARARTRVE